ncbi:RNA-binding protein 47 [Platysternon megacephalum]|uniref:RNA-binding protein 47 n=1 Tax=Platysternon megacephalum TaxID=55544 RepID=A0A4D9F6V4_9SAUR|nr:RNA-binding protein 47 [Platysternon megacephalum]
MCVFKRGVSALPSTYWVTATAKGKIRLGGSRVCSSTLTTLKENCSVKSKSNYYTKSHHRITSEQEIAFGKEYDCGNSSHLDMQGSRNLRSGCKVCCIICCQFNSLTIHN